MSDTDAWGRDREADRLDAQDAAARARLMPTPAPTDRVGDPPSLLLWHCGDPHPHAPHPTHAYDRAHPDGMTVQCAGSPLPPAGAGIPPAVTVNVEAPTVTEPDEVPNRWLHVVVSLLTGGAWLLGWAVIELRVARRNRRRAAARLKAVRRGR